MRRTRKIKTEKSYVDLVGHRVVNLHAKFKRSHYKSDTKFIDAVYMHNKKFIDSHLPSNGGITKRLKFRHLVEQYRDVQHISAQSAINILASTEAMTTAQERMQRNITKAITKNPSIYKEFKNKLGLSKKQDLDPSKFWWNYNEEAYEYDGYFVEIDNSPKKGNYTIKIRKIK